MSGGKEIVKTAYTKIRETVLQQILLPYLESRADIQDFKFSEYYSKTVTSLTQQYQRVNKEKIKTRGALD